MILTAPEFHSASRNGQTTRLHPGSFRKLQSIQRPHVVTERKWYQLSRHEWRKRAELAAAFFHSVRALQMNCGFRTGELHWQLPRASERFRQFSSTMRKETLVSWGMRAFALLGKPRTRFALVQIGKIACGSYLNIGIPVEPHFLGPNSNPAVRANRHGSLGRMTWRGLEMNSLSNDPN